MKNKTDYMGHMDNILLATDGSERCEGAIKEAIYLAKSCTATLSIISVIETNPEFEAYGQKFVEKIEGNLRNHLDKIREKAAGENVECLVILKRNSQPYKAIIEEARDRRSDVIVMGRRGLTGLSKALMGSVTAKVIGSAPCNVLVVPYASRINCKNILAATDGSEYGNVAVKEAIIIAKRCESKLTIISVESQESLLRGRPSQADVEDMAGKELSEAGRNVKALKEQAIREKLNTEGLILSGSPGEAIIKTAKEKDSDLIIMGRFGKSGLAGLLMGSTIERVIKNAPCPVLAVRR